MLEFPWPPSELHPNSRIDRRYSTRIRQSYIKECWALTLGNCINADTNISTEITFHPPNKIRRDLDGMLSAFKYGLDGIALAFGIDDSKFRPITLNVGEPVKNGKVVVRFI